MCDSNKCLLCAGEQQEVGAGGEGAAASADMVETARAWARPVHTELDALATLKKLLERCSPLTQYTFPYTLTLSVWNHSAMLSLLDYWVT